MTKCLRCNRPTRAGAGVCSRGPCASAYQRAYRRQTQNAGDRRYGKTANGFLMRAYSNMQGRVTGTQREYAHLYKGLPILSREEFYAWARDSRDFWRLFRLWKAADCDFKLSPSVNRIDTTKGYVLGNIEWLTHSVNSALANHQRTSALERVYALSR